MYKCSFPFSKIDHPLRSKYNNNFRNNNSTLYGVAITNKYQKDMLLHTNPSPGDKYSLLSIILLNYYKILEKYYIKKCYHLTVIF